MLLLLQIVTMQPPPSHAVRCKGGSFVDALKCKQCKKVEADIDKMMLCDNLNISPTCLGCEHVACYCARTGMKAEDIGPVAKYDYLCAGNAADLLSFQFLLASSCASDADV